VPDTSEGLGRLRTNLFWGLGYGLLFATAFSAFILILSVIRGSRPFDSVGMAPTRIITIYYIAGTVAGAAVGLLRPYCRRRSGALIVGAIGGVVVYGAVGIAMYGWTNIAIFGALVAGIPGGALVGQYWWKRPIA
jgi:hypothetical protein